MAKRDDHFEAIHTERALGRGVDDVLARLSASASEVSPPTLEPEFALNKRGPGRRSAWLLCAAVIFLVLCASIMLAPGAGQSPEARRALVRMESALRAEEVRARALEARSKALARQLEVVRVERDRALLRLSELAPASEKTVSVSAASADNIVDSTWTVSLMTLSAQAPALEFAQRVRAEGWPAEVLEVGERGGLWRISSGSFKVRAEAEVHAGKLAEALELDSLWITQRSNAAKETPRGGD